MNNEYENTKGYEQQWNHQYFYWEGDLNYGGRAIACLSDSVPSDDQIDYLADSGAIYGFNEGNPLFLD